MKSCLEWALQKQRPQLKLYFIMMKREYPNMSSTTRQRQHTSNSKIRTLDVAQRCISHLRQVVAMCLWIAWQSSPHDSQCRTTFLPGIVMLRYKRVIVLHPQAYSKLSIKLARVAQPRASTTRARIERYVTKMTKSASSAEITMR